MNRRPVEDDDPLASAADLILSTVVALCFTWIAGRVLVHVLRVNGWL